MYFAGILLSLVAAAKIWAQSEETGQLPDEFLPLNCSGKITKTNPSSIDCEKVIPLESRHLLKSNVSSVNTIWNSGSYVPVTGYTCAKVLIRTTCSEGFFWNSMKSSDQSLMLITIDECKLHIRRLRQTGWTPTPEIEYDCRWMQTSKLETVVYQVTPSSLKYDLLRARYLISEDNSIYCEGDPCVMPDKHSIWLPDEQVIHRCEKLTKTEIKWTPTPMDRSKFYSLSLHAQSLKRSCRASICSVPGLILETGEWIAFASMPGFILHEVVHNVTNCSDNVELISDLDKELPAKKSYNRIATQILFHSCQTTKTKLMTAESDLVPSEIHNIVPKKVGYHPGYFLINRTLFEVNCYYNAIRFDHSVFPVSKSDYYLGLDHTTDAHLFYKGKVINYNNLSIGPNGLIWENGSLLVIENNLERSLLKNIDLDPLFIQAAKDRSIHPSKPFDVSDSSLNTIDLEQVKRNIVSNRDIGLHIIPWGLISCLSIVLCFSCVKYLKTSLQWINQRSQTFQPPPPTTSQSVRYSPDENGTIQIVVEN